MLTVNELKSYAHMRRLRTVDQILKDYIQDVVLHLLYKKKPDIVFRGGTCIWKVYKGDRFSEDLDMRADSPLKNVSEYLVKELEYLGFTARIIKKKETANMVFLKLGIASLAHRREITLSVEILTAEKASERTEKATLYSPYPDIPPIEVMVPAPAEIVADKVSAICARDKPRDVHDLYILLRQGVKVDRKLLTQRVPGFSPQFLRKKMEEKQKHWRSLEPLVVTKLPKLEDEIRFILSSID
jgi:predicted nucleotidyltransferase component of viral defense system